MMIKISYQDINLWERQAWDTKAGYENFRGYYFPQEKGKRSINEAWRRANPGRATTKGGQKQVAPANWNRWAAGKTSTNKQIYIVVIQEDGSEIIRKAFTWAERAQAFDDHLAQRDIDKRKKAAEKLSLRLEEALDNVTEKVLAAINSYTPQNENLTTLTLSLDRIVAAAQKLQYLPTNEDGDQEETAEQQQAGGGMKDQIEKMNAIAAILERANQRETVEAGE